MVIFIFQGVVWCNKVIFIFQGVVWCNKVIFIFQGFAPSAESIAATSAGGFTILSEKKLFLGQKVEY